MAIKEQYKKRYLKLNPNLNNDSGIYIYNRINEEDWKLNIYVGQSLHIIDRLCSHSQGYKQHIDRSIRSHGLYSEDNPHGWNVDFINYPKEQLDEMERYWIDKYIKEDARILNKTSGGQDDKKEKIAEYTKHKRNYSDGIKQGRKNLAKELSHIIDLHLNITLKKPGNKVSQKQYEKFYQLLSEAQDN